MKYWTFKHKFFIAYAKWVVKELRYVSKPAIKLHFVCQEYQTTPHVILTVVDPLLRPAPYTQKLCPILRGELAIVDDIVIGRATIISELGKHVKYIDIQNEACAVPEYAVMLFTNPDVSGLLRWVVPSVLPYLQEVVAQARWLPEHKPEDYGRALEKTNNRNERSYGQVVRIAIGRRY